MPPFPVVRKVGAYHLAEPHTPRHFRLPSRRRLYYRAELPAARAATSRQNLRAPFVRLERAYTLGQRQALPHIHTHLLLRHSLPTRDEREILDQPVRSIGGFPLSCFGHHPHRAGVFGLQRQAGTACRAHHKCS
ncbi:DUF3703 domain-containing protein [Hymenobacter sp. ISL-91]|uniref:DUF3703 domain-containing protein n=1 Tax=Hymenobacter sp. ISL-91 TaxID=2819151 RepID=UPI001BE63933|nr:DUF3703 domain-containing protein [Hymenobacter sp. ISL-91]